MSRENVQVGPLRLSSMISDAGSRVILIDVARFRECVELSQNQLRKQRGAGVRAGADRRAIV